jgi:hypothetical protein
MSKKTKLLKDLLVLLADPDIYHVYSDSGDGFRHEYTIKIRETESGTMYSMEYSDTGEWSEEIRGVNVFHILNTGSGFRWVDTLPELVLEYDQMYQLQVFLRFIQDIEASGNYTTKVLKVEEVSSYKF